MSESPKKEEKLYQTFEFFRAVLNIAVYHKFAHNLQVYVISCARFEFSISSVLQETCQILRTIQALTCYTFQLYAMSIRSYSSALLKKLASTVVRAPEETEYPAPLCIASSIFPLL